MNYCGIVYFYKVRFQHLGLLANIEDSTLFLRVSLYILFVRRFRRRIQIRRRIFWPFLCKLPSLSCPISLWVSTLVTGFLIISPLVWQSLFGILLVPRLPVWQVIQSSWKYCFATASNVPVSFCSLISIFIVLWQIRDWWDSSLIYDR